MAILLKKLLLHKSMAESHTQNVDWKGQPQKYMYCMFPFKESSKISNLTYSENDSLWWVSPRRDIRSLLGCWTFFSLGQWVSTVYPYANIYWPVQLRHVPFLQVIPQKRKMLCFFLFQNDLFTLWDNRTHK